MVVGKSHISREEMMKHQMKEDRMYGVTKRNMSGEETGKKSIVIRQSLLSATGTAQGTRSWRSSIYENYLTSWCKSLSSATFDPEIKLKIYVTSHLQPGCSGQVYLHFLKNRRIKQWFVINYAELCYSSRITPTRIHTDLNLDLSFSYSGCQS